jgi:HSP20 family molecular chaperone IbpA
LSKEKVGMTRLSLVNSPFLLGFEHVERTLDRIAKTAGEGYPPYNIEQIGPNRLRITLAVAGFTRGDLSIEVENNQLTIRGKQQEEPGKVYLHRGIAARQFQRSFVLVEGIEVTGASLDNGLLNVELERPEPKCQARTVEITTGGKRTAADTTVAVETDKAS